MLSGPAHVDTVWATFTGTLTGRSHDDNNYVGFGSGSGVLDGVAISGIVTYDTDLVVDSNLTK